MMFVYNLNAGPYTIMVGVGVRLVMYEGGRIEV